MKIQKSVGINNIKESEYIFSFEQLNDIAITIELANLVYSYYEKKDTVFANNSKLSEWRNYSISYPKIDGPLLNHPIKHLRQKLDTFSLAKINWPILAELEKVAWIDIENPDIQILICRNYRNGLFYKKKLFITFRGTEFSSIKEWQLDADYSQIVPFWITEKNSKVRIHKGFANGYRKVADLLTDICRKENAEQIIVSGHSQGGALSEICVAHLEFLRRQKKLQNQQHCCIFGYTCGQPRVGNTEWQELFQSLSRNYFRLVNETDIVPDIPFETMIAIGYKTKDENHQKTPEFFLPEYIFEWLKSSYNNKFAKKEKKYSQIKPFLPKGSQAASLRKMLENLFSNQNPLIWIERLNFRHVGIQITLDTKFKESFLNKLLYFIQNKTKPHWSKTYIQNFEKFGKRLLKLLEKTPQYYIHLLLQKFKKVVI